MRKTLFGIATLMALGCSGNEDDSLSEPLAAKESVSVDLGKPIGTAERRAMGFLCGVWEHDPGNVDLDPLGITFARGDAWGPCPLRYDRLKPLGTATFDRILSDDWNLDFHDASGATYGSPWPGDGGNWSKWESWVKGQVSGFGAGPGAINWEIWNEPDGGNFWAVGWTRYKEAWKHAVQAIRSVDKNAHILGPSLSGFHQAQMQDFLDYAHMNNVLPDIISWHELGRNSPPNIQAHVETLEKMSLPIYGKHVPVHINEYVDNDNTKDAHQYSPGQTLWFIANLERAQVEHAGHSCWNEVGGGNNCTSGTLSGLLTHDGKRERRSTWYAYERYAKITGTLVEVMPSGNVDGVAGVDGGGTVRILLGNHSDRRTSRSSTCTSPGIAASKVHVVVGAIHHSGPSASAAPANETDKDEEVTGRRARPRARRRRQKGRVVHRESRRNEVSSVDGHPSVRRDRRLCELVHAIVTGGGLSEDGSSWVGTRPNFFRSTSPSSTASLQPAHVPFPSEPNHAERASLQGPRGSRRLMTRRDAARPAARPPSSRRGEMASQPREMHEQSEEPSLQFGGPSFQFVDSNCRRRPAFDALGELSFHSRELSFALGELLCPRSERSCATSGPSLATSEPFVPFEEPSLRSWGRSSST